MEASQFLHQSVELEEVQVPVAQHWFLVDGGSYRRINNTIVRWKQVQK